VYFLLIQATRFRPTCTFVVAVVCFVKPNLQTHISLYSGCVFRRFIIDDEVSSDEEVR